MLDGYVPISVNWMFQNYRIIYQLTANVLSKGAGFGLYLAVHGRSSGHTGKVDLWHSSHLGTSRPLYGRPLAPTEGSHRSDTHAAWRLIDGTDFHS